MADSSKRAKVKEEGDSESMRQPPMPPPPPNRPNRKNEFYHEQLAVAKTELTPEPSADEALTTNPPSEPGVQPSSSASGPDRSRGPIYEARSEVNHLMFASYVLHDELPDRKSIEGLLQHPGSHIVAVICEHVHGAEQEEMRRLAQETVLGGKTIHEVCPGCFVVTHNALCRGVQLLPDAAMKAFGFTLGVVEVTLLPPQPAVVIGLLNSPLSPEDPSLRVLELMKERIVHYGVRILTGIFPNCRDDSVLARVLLHAGAACPPLRQPFWGRDGSKYAWPHQVVLFGPTKDVFAVADDQIPTWEELRTRFKDAGSDFLGRLYEQMQKVESLSRTNQVWAKNLSQARIATTKQKSVAWKWWIPGTHQIVLWIDGRRANERRGAGSEEKRQAWLSSKRRR